MVCSRQDGLEAQMDEAMQQAGPTVSRSGQDNADSGGGDRASGVDSGLGMYRGEDAAYAFGGYRGGMSQSSSTAVTAETEAMAAGTIPFGGRVPGMRLGSGATGGDGHSVTVGSDGW